MEDIGTEVSLKIRSAIKAKLMELGAFVDDELPDYIMVMVANKRSKQQMETDLQLFLGSNTVNFTGWLHTVLQKLEEVTIANNLALSQKKAADTSKHADGAELSSKSKPGGPDGDGHKHKHEKRKKSSEGSSKRATKESKSGGKTSSGKKSTKTKVLDVSDVANGNGAAMAGGSFTAKASHIGVSDLDSGSKSVDLRTTNDVMLLVKKEVDSQQSELPAKKTVSATPAPAVQKPSPRSSAVLQSDEDDDDFINIKDDAEAMELLDTELSDSHKQSRKVVSAKAKAVILQAPISVPADEEVDELEQQRANLLRDLKLLDNTKPTLAKRSALFDRLGSKVSALDRLGARPRLNIIDPNELDIVGPTPREVALTKLSVADRLGKRVETSPRRSNAVSDEPPRERRADRREPEERETVKPSVRERLGERMTSVSHNDRKQRPGTTGPTVMERLGKKVTDRPGKRRTSDSEGEERPNKKRILNIKEALMGETQHGGASKRPADQQRSDDDEVPQKKRSLLSRVVAVKRDTAAEQDEEYDPTNPAVASVIRVKPRPKVPAAMQATKNLLLKAMAEAQKSVSTAPKRQEPQRAQESLYTRKYRGSGQQLEKINITVSNLPKQSVEEECEDSTNEDGDEGLEDNKRGGGEKEMPKTETDGRGETERKVRQKIVVELPTEVKITTGTDDRAAADKVEEEEVEEEEEDDVVFEEIFDDDVNEDDPVEMTASNGGDSNLGNVSPIEEEYVPTKIGGGTKPPRKTGAGGRASSPQFVVTLDGLDPDIFNPRKRTVDSPQIQEQEQESGVVSPVPELDSDTDDRIHNWLLSLDRAKKEEEQNEHDTPPSPVVYKKPKLAVVTPVVEPAKPLPAERCKYWPACSKGELCEFLHPSTPCKMFPGCKFGDRCLYVHPNCKFDISCTRRECPYSHTGTRSGTSQVQVSTSGKSRPHSQPLCKFYPKCSNVNCSFLHPKPCRFGRACTNRDCSFFHEEIPTAEKLKWVNSNRF